MNKKKSGFSFLEMLIVVLIVSILFVALRWAFEIKNKNIFYGQACVETVYGEINNFLYAGLSSKSLFTWNISIFPDQYTISFDSIQQRIELKYTEKGNEYTYNTIPFTGNSNIAYCSSNNYAILLTWKTYEIHINKWLQEDTNLQSFYLTWGYTWSIWGNEFLLCSLQWTGCKTIARFESDSRTLSITKQICLNLTNTGSCNDNDWDN